MVLEFFGQVKQWYWRLAVLLCMLGQHDSNLCPYLRFGHSGQAEVICVDFLAMLCPGHGCVVDSTSHAVQKSAVNQA
jgi:hypothetical protein